MNKPTACLKNDLIFTYILFYLLKLFENTATRSLYLLLYRI